MPIDASPAGKESVEPVRALIEPFDYTEFDVIREKVRKSPRITLLALDHLQDPQNFGALCRTAEGLGLGAVLIPKDRGATVSAGVYHASVGAVETIPIVMVASLAEALRKLKEDGVWVVGSTLGGETHAPGKTPSFEKVVIVLGAEGEGMSPSLQKLCDWNIEIPLGGKIQSLNVSVAGGILMYHFTQNAR